ncbi:MAG: hypothetical protein JNK64_20930 [Myxococcales bacterium]|nr:hypothetical protein [Myxococcales bacterium]
MTTNTLTALEAGGCEVVYVVQIEGYDAILATGRAAAALAAWQASDAAGHSEVNRAFGGLSVIFDQNTAASPWEPFGQPPICRLAVIADIDANGDLSDDFAVDVFKRSGGTETHLTGTLAPDATTVAVRSAGSFASSGVAHVGPEAIFYSGKTGTSFTGATRGVYCPHHTDGGGRFARSHIVRDLTTATGDPVGVGLPPLVTDEPRGFVGRWVGVWLCRVVDGAVEVSEQSHLAFAGKIAGITEGENGETVIECEHALRSIFETKLMGDPFTSTVADGVYVATGMEFNARTIRGTSAKTATPLVVVSGAPASANEIQAGPYSAERLAQSIMAWLQSEYNAGQISFPLLWRVGGGPGGVSVIRFVDSGGAVGLDYFIDLPDATIARFLGWDDPNIHAADVVTAGEGRRYSDHPPLRTLVTADALRLYTANDRGTWIDQADIMPAPLRSTVVGDAEGIIKIGDGYAVAQKLSGYFRLLTPTGQLSRYLPPRQGEIAIEVDDDQAVPVQQVLLIESDFQSLLLKLLLSTGATGHNHATYDTLSAELGCAIPYSLLSDSFVDDAAGVAAADATLAMVIDRPTRFVDLFNVDFILRFCFLTWGAGRLHLKSWGTPTAGAATVALTESNKAIATERAASDKQRSAGEERFEFIRNQITVRYGRNADGTLVSSVPIVDKDSVAAYGSRGLTLDAANTIGQSAIGDLQGLVARFAATLPLFSRPHKIITRTVGLELFESLTVGTYVTITDSHIRNPETGLRGITGWPGVVVANRHDWGGPMFGVDGAAPSARSLFGEVSVMIFDRVSEAPYCPAAQVDHTATNAGYDAGTKTLKCKSHEYSTASMAVDASRFTAGDEVRITEIDPPDPAAALSWDRTVASISTDEIILTSTLSAPAWDTAKKYRITSVGYGSAASSQRVNAYQADDADGLVANARQPYAMMSSGTGQSLTFTHASPSELPARYSTNQIGDGVAFDVGAARDLARLANNIVSYKSAPQAPTIYSEARSSTPTGTRVLLEVAPVFVGIGQLSASQSFSYYVAPMLRSKTGASVSVRVSLCRVMPQGGTLQDVTLVEPYQSATFSTSSTSYTIPTAQALSCGHLSLAPGPLGGVAWLVVESESANAEVCGVPVQYVGPLESAIGGAGLAMRPGVVEWQRDCLNGMTPSAQFYARLVGVMNHATAYRHRPVYARSWALGNSSYGYSGTTTLGRFRFRTGHGVSAIRILMILGRTATGGTGTDPRVTFTIDGSPPLTETFYYGLSPVAATDAPDELAIVGSTIAVSADTAYTGKLEAIDYGRVLAIVAYELGAETISESTEWFSSTIPQARAPIFDAFHGRLLQGLSEIHRHNAGTVTHWAQIDGSARTRTSATAANLVDGTTTGAPTTATPGVKLDLSYRATEGVATVPVELAVYGSMSSGSGTVVLVDSGGTTLATATINSATPAWYTATASLPASLAKYDLKFAGDGTNTISVYAASLIEWEA